MTSWPSHYPTSCPPDDAAPATYAIYRFTNRATINPKDFQSYYDRDPQNDWGDMACQARGLSVYPSFQACVDVAEKVPSLKKKKLAGGMLQESYGKLAATPSGNSSSHMTWWVSVGCPDPTTFFTNIASWGI